MIKGWIIDILQNVLDCDLDPPFRPSLTEIQPESLNEENQNVRIDDDVIAKLKTLINQCWASDWQARPVASKLGRDLGKVNPFKCVHFGLHMLELYNKVMR